MPIGILSTWAYARVAPRVRVEVPLIIESVIAADAIDREVIATLEAFPLPRGRANLEKEARPEVGSAAVNAT